MKQPMILQYTDFNTGKDGVESAQILGWLYPPNRPMSVSRQFPYPVSAFDWFEESGGDNASYFVTSSYRSSKDNWIDVELDGSGLRIG